MDEIKRQLDDINTNLSFIRVFLLAIVLIQMASCTIENAHADIDLSRIASIESSNNPMAFNPSSKATGLFQITPICLKDANQFAPDEVVGKECRASNYLHLGAYCERNVVTQEDLFNPIINTRIAEWYMNKRIPQLLNHFKKQDTVENRLIAYNCGVRCVGKPLPRETERYIKKYLAH